MKNGKPKRASAKNGAKAREFSVIIERDIDGWYVGSVPGLRGCHSQAKSLDQLMKRMREAIVLCLEVESDSPSSEFIGIQRLAVGQ